MKNFLSIIKSRTGGHSQGQTFIIIAAAFLALVAFLGLATDVGILFIAYGRLARSVDAAALAAASQIREGRTLAEMEETAANALTVNGVAYDNIILQMCDYSLPEEDRDPQLCTEPYNKKLVRVTVQASTPLAFLRVLGFDSMTLTSSAIAEAASMDVVLVIDISESMAWDSPPGDPLRDPHHCNDASIYDGSEDGNDYPIFPNGIPGECHPFEDVKAAAAEFVLRVLDKAPDEEEDRLAIITFGNGWSSELNRGTFERTNGWTADASVALGIVSSHEIFDPPPCDDINGNPTGAVGACRKYDYSDPNTPYEDPEHYLGMDCYTCRDAGDYSTLTSTNLGGGLLLAGNMFNLDTRQDAVWIVVALTDGMANATVPDVNDDLSNYATYPIGYCPNELIFPLCQDENILTRHDSTHSLYDADDYARDMADYVGCYPTNQAPACGSQQGQGAVMFAIGLGDGVLDTTNEVDGKPYGTALLRYIAAVGDDGNADTDLCRNYWEDAGDWEEWCGNYYFSPEGDQLSAVFEDIASRIFTRLNR